MLKRFCDRCSAPILHDNNFKIRFEKVKFSNHQWVDDDVINAVVDLCYCCKKDFHEFINNPPTKTNEENDE